VDARIQAYYGGFAEGGATLHEAALRTVRAPGDLPGVADLSNHMMGIARVS